MFKPTIDKVKNLAKDNRIIPVSMEIFSDIKTPIEVLKNLMRESNKYYLLESVEGGEKWGRYSFLGFNPTMQIKCKDGLVEVIGEKIKKIETDNPSEIIREILKDYKSPKLEYLPSFTGGFVGYFSYDYIKYNEKSLKLNGKDDVGFSDFDLMLFDKIIAFDHLRQKIIIIVNMRTDNIEENYENAIKELKIIEKIIKGSYEEKINKSKLESDFKSIFTEEEYCGKVEKIKGHIKEGDIFQAVLSNRFEAEFSGDLLSTYRVLRTINPSPYMFYLNTDDIEIAGASPETLVKLNEGNLLTFPIAGTSPRGKSSKEDKEFIKALLKDEKELSEHNMLVDLGRNDLGKISEFGTVKVENYLEVLKFSHVIHIASTVKGKLRKDLDQLDAINSVLVAGTLSGAPKVRACEILNSLERNKRGVYGGAIGYIDFTGNMDVCIAIRMAVKKENKVYVQAGAGIVADSEANTEYREAINKCKSVIEALKMSEEVDN